MAASDEHEMPLREAWHWKQSEHGRVDLVVSAAAVIASGLAATEGTVTPSQRADIAARAVDIAERIVAKVTGR